MLYITQKFTICSNSQRLKPCLYDCNLVARQFFFPFPGTLSLNRRENDKEAASDLIVVFAKDTRCPFPSQKLNRILKPWKKKRIVRHSWGCWSTLGVENIITSRADLAQNNRLFCPSLQRRPCHPYQDLQLWRVQYMLLRVELLGSWCFSEIASLHADVSLPD